MGGSSSNIPNIPSNYQKLNNNNNSSEVSNKDEGAKKKEEEVKSYLGEKRGKIGTITTSWQGVLKEKNDGELKRKTLLGE
ncbi:MAG: hypothetical protein OIF36_04480 [Alphaproteobacteria bacterium]|jgi:hypothetical protein|nr:hypothetical protein [Alphaproteobacteria bacterium]MCV6599712.1 hypothetical protein [Alphaproteobacteria bacterium]